MESLVYILIILLIIILPTILKWYHKKGIYKNSSISKEIIIKWQSFDTKQKKRPFSGWYTATSGTLIITQNSISLGQVSIPFKEIKKAILFKLSDSIIKEFSSILRLETDYLSYDVSISPYQIENLKLPIELITEKTEFIPKIYKFLIWAVIIIIFVIMVFIDHFK